MIQVQKTHFEFDQIKESIVGAGIIPVAVDARERIHLLLGKERYINHWRGSLKWSGFEGGRKSGEDIEQTAAREFLEESLGTVPLRGCEPTVESIVAALRNELYTTRIVLCILHGEDSERRYHVTYVFESTLSEKCVEDFSAQRHRLLELDAMANELARASLHVSKADLPFEDKEYKSRTVLGVSRVERVDKTVLLIDFQDVDGVTRNERVEDVSEDLCDAYSNWFLLRQRCSTQLKKEEACALALCIKKDGNGLVTDLQVIDDFIEKQSIRWWSASELEVVFLNGGLYRTEYFRAYFLPVLQQTLKELGHRDLQEPSLNTLRD